MKGQILSFILGPFWMTVVFFHFNVSSVISVSLFAIFLGYVCACAYDEGLRAPLKWRHVVTLLGLLVAGFWVMTANPTKPGLGTWLPLALFYILVVIIHAIGWNKEMEIITTVTTHEE